MSITNLVVPEERNKVEAFARNMINKGDKKWRNTLKHVKKNGEVMYMDIASHRITYNNTLAILSLAENVTEKVKIQEQLKKSYDDIRLLNEHLETVREEERAGIAREIHDELGQQLTAIKMDASWISARVNGSNAQMSERLASMMSLIDETVKTIRRIASDLRPGILDDLGLIAAIEWLCTEFEKRTGVKTVIQTNITDIDIDKKIATGIFRVYQEIFTNISRHAKASLVITHIELAGNWFIMSVTDNGIGFNTEEVNTKNTLGLLGMNERINMLNGYLQIDSLPGNGTKILVKIPLTKKT
jgi:signal transduction histidine kinase